MYTCDNWVVIKIEGKDPHYRLLVGTSGGYTQGSSWRLNSGILKFKSVGDYWEVYGHSGSVYKCHKEVYGLRMNNAYIWEKLKKKHGDLVSLLDEDTDWESMKWIISDEE